MNVTERLKRAFEKALGVKIDDFKALEYRGLPAWDSVAHMTLVGEIEAEFDIMLDTDDVIGMSSFTKACDIVTKHGVDLSA